ncbi:MAG TPA: hypothetical protein VF387_02575, partial [Gemmatimonadaceae bacterium]
GRAIEVVARNRYAPPPHFSVTRRLADGFCVPTLVEGFDPHLVGAIVHRALIHRLASHYM